MIDGNKGWLIALATRGHMQVMVKMCFVVWLTGRKLNKELKRCKVLMEKRLIFLKVNMPTLKKVAICCHVISCVSFESVSCAEVILKCCKCG